MALRSKRLTTLAITLLLPGLIAFTGGTAVADPTGPEAPVPVPTDQTAISPDDGETTPAVIAPSLQDAEGTVTVSVALSEQPVAATVPDGAIAENALPPAGSQRTQTDEVTAQQDQLVAEAADLGADELGRASAAANVVALTIPADNLARLAALPGVLSVKPVGRYETHEDAGGSGSLAQAAEYLQATSVRAAGNDGTGVRIAVVDSGIDFTHRNLGGPGTVAAYQACHDNGAANQAPTGDCAALFGPAAPKVKGGYDFIGETWPITAAQPDPNPIDQQGHGTHVADIAAGRSADGSHLGIAPGAEVYALRVCSAVATTCSGVALLQALDWALDPNGDKDISDAVDIVNMSLGSNYGQAQDDLSAAVNNLVRAGVVVVASAGNAADRPFIVGSPSTAEGAISVAQTALPDDKLYTIAVNSPTIPGLPGNTIRNSKLQSWSPAPTAPLTAPLVRAGDDQQLGCTDAAFTGFPAGAVALVKRGLCAASVKAQKAQAAGAAAVVIWNNVAGDPPDFSFGGGDPVTVPTLTIALANGTMLSTAAPAGAVQVTIDPAATTALTNTVVGTSSRGLAISGLRAKPDIGAPGAWLSAEVGTGGEETNFGGTSGAAPVVTGAAALVLDRYPTATPAVVKARLLNGASMDSRTPDADAQLYPTPISRVGAGEVRIAPAVDAVGVALNTQGGGGNLGLGMPSLTTLASYPVVLRVRNTGPTARTYRLTTTFRDAGDQASRAVSVSTPSTLRVPGRGSADVVVTVAIDPTRLAAWPFTHAAGRTGDGSALNLPEFDGYVTATSGSEVLHLGWTVLPQRSADVSAAGSVRLTRNSGPLALSNRSRASDGPVNVFGLTGTSPRLPRPVPGQPGSAGSNVALVDLAAVGVRDNPNLGYIQFAIAGQQRQTSPLYPAGYEVDVDTNRDGTADYAVYQQESVGFGASGQSVVYVANLASGATSAHYYTDSDFDVSTQVLSAPLEALGLSAGSTFDFDVFAYDNYFSGRTTDRILDQTWTVGSTKYALGDAVVPAGGRLNLSVTRNATAGPATQTGLLLLYDNAASRDAQAVTVNGG